MEGISFVEIRESYREVFGRDPSDAELSDSVNNVQGGGLTYEDVVSQHANYLLTQGLTNWQTKSGRTYRSVFGAIKG